jgi:hypothetical protein
MPEQRQRCRPRRPLASRRPRIRGHVGVGSGLPRGLQTSSVALTDWDLSPWRPVSSWVTPQAVVRPRLRHVLPDVLRQDLVDERLVAGPTTLGLLPELLEDAGVEPNRNQLPRRLGKGIGRIRGLSRPPSRRPSRRTDTVSRCCWGVRPVRRRDGAASVLSRVRIDNDPERGARLTRREE